MRELPSVRLALRWLLQGRGKTSDRALIVRAHVSGLARSGARGSWRANGRMATRLVHWGRHRMPDDPAQLGQLLHGLGEIHAHSEDAQFAQPLIDHLKRRRYCRRQLVRILDAAAKCESVTKGPVSLDTFAFAQWISRATLNWDTFHDAAIRIDRVYEPGIYGHFGLRFAARIMLAIDIHAVDQWIASRAGQPILAVVGSAAVTAVVAAETPSRIIPLLESRMPAITSLAAASLVCPHPLRAANLNYRDCQQALVEGGVNPGDATWMMGLRIKEAIHQRYILEHKREECEAHLRVIEQNPSAAIGGTANVDAERRSLRAQLANVSERHGNLLPTLEQKLTDMAAGWPGNGLSDEQMAALENIFVETPEIRYRLAEKLTHPANRAWLLKRNIAQLQDFVDLKNSEKTCKDYFYPDEKRFAIIAPWAAKSIVLHYSEDHRGIGKRTSDLVKPLAESSLALLDQPFIAARQPTQWQSVVTRSACADIFALMVVASVPEGRRDEVAALNGLALAHALKLLRGPLPEQHPPRVFQQLATYAIQQMASEMHPDDIRRTWALTGDLSNFVRALVLWSSPVLVEANAALAFDLFRRVGEVPLCKSRFYDQLSRLLTLLDAAVAACAAARKHDLLSSITTLWNEIYKDWLGTTDRFANAAEMLAAAVGKDGPERAAMVADPVWSQSACLRLIESVQAKPAES